MSNSGLNDEVETINGYNRLNFNLEKDASIILEPSTLIHMDGNLTLEPTMFSQGGIFSAFKRSLTGKSFIDSQITNKTDKKLKLSLCPTLLGTINKIEIQPNQIWRFTPSSFIACTSNILVSGNLNIFSNFKALLGGQNILYTELSTQDGKPGIVWISAHGAMEKHEVQMGKDSEKLVINDGIFLGMLSEENDKNDKNKNINYWDKFVNVGSANGFFKGLLTRTALLMRIEDNNKNTSDNTKCIVYTQSLNIRNFQNYIQSIVINTVGQNNNNNNNINTASNVISLFTGGNNYNKYQKYNNKLNNI